MPVGPNYRGLTTTTGEAMPVSAANSPVIGGATSALPSTLGAFNPTDNGFSANFLGDTGASLDALNAGLLERIEAGRVSAEAGIRNSAAINREEIEQNQAEGNRQIGYAAERLGGSVILRRNVEDFTANVSKFHADIDRSLERLDIEMNTALASNNNNAWNQMFNIQKSMYESKLQMYDRAVQFYFDNARLALQQHESANADLDTMLKWASLDGASDAELDSISKATGFSRGVLDEMIGNANKTFNASIANKGGVTYPAALVPWQATVDASLEAGLSPGIAVQDAITEAHSRGVELSESDIAALQKYADEQKAIGDAATAAGGSAGETTGGSGNVGTGNTAGGTTRNGIFLNPRYNLEGATTVDAMSDALFGRYNTE